MASVTNCHYLCHKLGKDLLAPSLKLNGLSHSFEFCHSEKGARNKNPLKKRR